MFVVTSTSPTVNMSRISHSATDSSGSLSRVSWCVTYLPNTVAFGIDTVTLSNYMVLRIIYIAIMALKEWDVEKCVI